MKSIQQLKQYLAPAPTVKTGTVLSVSGQAVQVNTASGVVDARSVDATTYRAGDEVLLRGGIVSGRVRAAASVPIYYV